MESVTVNLKNKKAKQLLNDLAESGMIEITENKYLPTTANKLSHLKNLIKKKMSEAEINKQLQTLRNEWQRDI